MKRLYFNLSILCCSIFLFSCNNSGKKKEEAKDTAAVTPVAAKPREIDCKTIGNFLVSQRWAEDKRERFERIYRTNAPAGLTHSFWIDSCVIGNFQRFLTANEANGYDGVRFYSYAENDFADLVMVPTKTDGGTRHISQWGVVVSPFSGCSKPEFKNFNKTMQQMEDKMREFRHEYRNEKAPFKSEYRDSLSGSIWFSKCVFDAMVSYLEDPKHKLDGVRIYGIAYDKKYQGTMQDYPQQSSFVMVVTRPNGRKHTDAWDVLGTKYAKDLIFEGGGYNHGQLCPSICD